MPAGTRRGTAASPNAFYMESLIDELAHLAGKDPLRYRRELVARNPGRRGPGGLPQRDDWIKALDIVEKLSGWRTLLPEGWGRGLAIDDRRHPERDSITIAAQVFTVEVTRRGQLQLHRVGVAFEEGYGEAGPATQPGRHVASGRGKRRGHARRRRAVETKQRPTGTSASLYTLRAGSEGIDMVLPADGNDPRNLCEPLGVPRYNHYNVRLTQIMQDEFKVTIVYHYDNRWRIIWTGISRAGLARRYKRKGPLSALLES